MPRAIVIKTYGDPHIADAIEDALTPPAPLTPDQTETVMAEIDRQRILPSLVRVAVGNTTTPDEYEAMMTRERYKRQRYERPESIGRAVGDFLLVAWAMLWLGIYGCAEYLSAWNREGDSHVR